MSSWSALERSNLVDDYPDNNQLDFDSRIPRYAVDKTTGDIDIDVGKSLLFSMIQTPDRE